MADAEKRRSVPILVTHVPPELRARVQAAAKAADRSLAAEVRRTLTRVYPPVPLAAPGSDIAPVEDGRG